MKTDGRREHGAALQNWSGDVAGVEESKLLAVWTEAAGRSAGHDAAMAETTP